jgi:hypothetical protein
LTQQHDPNYRVDRQRWATLTIFEQLGNIGSEVGRAFKAKKKQKDFEPALIRALDLFDATAEHMLQTAPHRLQELYRAKEQFLDALYKHDDYELETYFNQFAIAARLQHEAKQN